MPGRIFIITGPSGVGKTSVATRLMEKEPRLKKVITCTTRPPREGEQDGVDYRFYTEDAFQKMIEAGEMFEWARVYDRYYGSKKEDVRMLQEQDLDVLFVIDVQGAKTIQEEHPEATVFFLQAESPDILLARLEKRDKGTTENWEERKEALQQEMAFSTRCKHVITNAEGKLDETADQILEMMREA